MPENGNLLYNENGLNNFTPLIQYTVKCICAYSGEKKEIAYHASHITY